MNALRSIAVAQTCPVAGDVPANTDEHLRLARLAAAEGARVVVFPELSLIGYELGLARAAAFTEVDPRLDPLRQAACDLALTLVAGAPVQLAGRLHIGAFLLLPDGSLDIYTKQRMGAFPPEACCDGVVPPAEATLFEPGNRNPLVDLGGGTAAVAVCADVGRPAHPEQAAARGATAYLASMFVIPSELTGELEKLGGYAARHAMLVAMANFGGPSGGLAAAGRSSIWSATGELLVQLPSQGAGVALVTETSAGVQTKALTVDGAR
jgi:predicted amidohydrolase